MATITERGGRYLARVRREGFKPVSRTFTRKTDAAAWARKVEADMEAGQWVEAADEVPTLAEALRQYRTTAAAKLKGAETYAYWFDELAACGLALRPVNTIKATDWAVWRDAQQAAGLKPGTVVRKLGLVSGFLSWCQRERGWIAAHPLRSVSKPRVNDARDRTLSDEEASYLTAAAESSRAPWLADAITVLVRSAMRRGELWGLTATAIDFDKATAYLADTKTGRARYVPLCPRALAALKRLSEAVAVGERLIPVAAPGAISLAFRRTLERAQKQYRRDCKARRVEPDAGFLQDFRCHDLRHEAVSRLARTGVLSVFELAAVSGHAGLASLKRYTNLRPTDVAAKLATLAANT